MKFIPDIIFKRQVKQHLVRSARERGTPWRDKKALKETISDVLALDQDLQSYVRDYLKDNKMDDSDIACEVVSIRDLVKGCGYDPLNAALTIQWFRSEPRAASAFLAQHDEIRNIPRSAADDVSEELFDEELNSRVNCVIAEES